MVVGPTFFFQFPSGQFPSGFGRGGAPSPPLPATWGPPAPRTEPLLVRLAGLDAAAMSERGPRPPWPNKDAAPQSDASGKGPGDDLLRSMGAAKARRRQRKQAAADALRRRVESEARCANSQRRCTCCA